MARPVQGIAAADRRRFNSARVHMYAPDEQRACTRERRRLDFYEPVATGVFKSAAEIAFLKLASLLTTRIEERNLILSILPTFKTRG